MKTAAHRLTPNKSPARLTVLTRKPSLKALAEIQPQFVGQPLGKYPQSMPWPRCARENEIVADIADVR